MLYRREGYPEEDEFVLCTVTKVLNHAVFVNLDEYDKGGLVHISEIAPGRIRNIREYVELGKKIVCKILRINHDRGHIDLSLRRVSDMERKKKLEEIKQEQKAEKIIEMVAQQLKKKVNEVYETVTSQVFEKYPFVHQFFKDVAIGEVKAKDVITDQKIAPLVQELALERFKPARVTIKGFFTITSFAPDGVNVIKEVLVEAEKKAKSPTTISIGYIGGGKYKTVIEAQNYKDAEKTLKVLQEFVEKKMSGSDSSAAFEREEA